MRSTHAARGDIAGDISVQSHAAEVIERLTVLLVGDNKPIRILLYDFLEGGGYNVLTAGNGEDALVVCREFRHPIALLQTDVEMAGMSGFELAEHASLLHPPWKVLFIPAEGGDFSSRQRRVASSTTFLIKPFSKTALLRTLKEAL